MRRFRANLRSKLRAVEFYDYSDCSADWDSKADRYSDPLPFANCRDRFTDTFCYGISYAQNQRLAVRNFKSVRGNFRQYRQDWPVARLGKCQKVWYWCQRTDQQPRCGEVQVGETRDSHLKIRLKNIFEVLLDKVEIIHFIFSHPSRQIPKNPWLYINILSHIHAIAWMCDKWEYTIY